MQASLTENIVLLDSLYERDVDDVLAAALPSIAQIWAESEAADQQGRQVDLGRRKSVDRTLLDDP
jgi:hypothetical protein